MLSLLGGVLIGDSTVAVALVVLSCVVCVLMVGVMCAGNAKWKAFVAAELAELNKRNSAVRPLL